MINKNLRRSSVKLFVNVLLKLDFENKFEKLLSNILHPWLIGLEWKLALGFFVMFIV